MDRGGDAVKQVQIAACGCCLIVGGGIWLVGREAVEQYRQALRIQS
jgi:hypothetical protein